MHHHDHGGDHGAHGHSHAPASFGRAFAIGTALNLAYVAVEAGFGLRLGSTSLLADAGHNLSDVLGLLVAWGGATLARRSPTPRRTYGFRGSTILAALANAVLLLIATGGIAWEALERFGQPPTSLQGGAMAAVAAGGIVVNGATALLFLRGRHGDLNIRGAYLHMLADAAVSAGVVAAGLSIAATGWLWLDPVVSLVIIAAIGIGTWRLLRDSVNMAMQAVPPQIDPADVQRYLASLPGVEAVHDLHIWGMSTTETALTAHLVRPNHDPADEDGTGVGMLSGGTIAYASADRFLRDTAASLHERFGIAHTTLQVERNTLVGECNCDGAPAARSCAGDHSHATSSPLARSHR